jgi:hypothetical protein
MTDLFDPDAEYDAKSTGDLLDLAWSGGTPIGSRARSVTALGRRAADSSVAEELAVIARDGSMRDARMFELVSLAHLAVAGLAHAATPLSRAAARAAVETLPEEDREALLTFLRSGDLTLDPSS